MTDDWRSRLNMHMAWIDAHPSMTQWQKAMAKLAVCWEGVRCKWRELVT